MKPARAVAADAAPAFAYLQRCDEREIDNPDHDDPRRFRYLERMHEVLRLARTAAPPARVAEIGCAQGNVSLLLAEAGYRAVAVDLRLDFVRYARAKWERGPLAVMVGDAFRLPLRSGAFDVVIVGELVEHVAEPAALLAEAARLLAPNGLLVVTTPNVRCVGAREPRFAEFARTRARHGVPVECGPGGDDHLFALTLGELVSLLPPGVEPIHRAHAVSRLINSRSHPVIRRLLGGVPAWLQRGVARLPGLGARLSQQLVVAARLRRGAA